MKPIRKPVRSIDREHNLVWVMGKHGKFPCRITKPSIKQGVRLGDDVSIVKSSVNGEWLCVDYHVDTPINYAIHNSYQSSYEDMIVDEKGVPYE